MTPIPVWVAGASGERSFEQRFSGGAAVTNLPSFKPDDDALILYTSGTTGEPKGVVLSYRNLLQYPRVMREMGVTDSSTMRGCMLPMSHIVGPVVCNELAEKGYTLVIFDQINPVTLARRHSKIPGRCLRKRADRVSAFARREKPGQLRYQQHEDRRDDGHQHSRCRCCVRFRPPSRISK